MIMLSLGDCGWTETTDVEDLLTPLYYLMVVDLENIACSLLLLEAQNQKVAPGGDSARARRHARQKLAPKINHVLSGIALKNSPPPSAVHPFIINLLHGGLVIQPSGRKIVPRTQLVSHSHSFLIMEDRKARLAFLKARAGRNRPTTEETTDAPEHSETREEQPSVTFRNYTPADASLEQKGSDGEPSVKKQKQEKSALQEALEKAQAEVKVSQTEQEDLTTVAPKKINWDLKRDIQPKLDKLERRTQKAIVELLKERLEREAAADEDVD